MINGFTKEEKRRHAYDMRENYQRILASYKATDFGEGRAEIVQAIKVKGYSNEQIAEITDLPLVQIETLLKKG